MIVAVGIVVGLVVVVIVVVAVAAAVETVVVVVLWISVYSQITQSGRYLLKVQKTSFQKEQTAAMYSSVP